MGDVFLSYRRDDSRSATGRLADRLQAAFGTDRVFRDIGSIVPGADFESALARAVGAATVQLAVVGPRFLTVVDGAGRRRLDDPSDLVRREIESALAAGVPVIPLLVEGARMPTPADLPPSLGAFGRLQAMTLDDARWSHDCEALIDVLSRHGVEPIPGAGPRRRGTLGGLAVDLIELVSRPGRLMRRLCGDGGVDTMLAALRLWIVALALGALVFGAVVADGGLSWLWHGALIGVLITLGLGVVVAAGWRLAGVRAGWHQATAGIACLTGGAWLLALLALVPVAAGAALADPQVFDRVRALARQSPMPWERLEALVTQSMAGPALAGAALSLLFWVGAGVWLVAAWNGLRRAWGATALSAVVAALGTAAMLWALAALLGWAAGA